MFRHQGTAAQLTKYKHFQRSFEFSDGDVRLPKLFRQTVPHRWPGGGKTVVTKLVTWSLDQACSIVLMYVCAYIRTYICAHIKVFKSVNMAYSTWKNRQNKPWNDRRKAEIYFAFMCHGDFTFHILHCRLCLSIKRSAIICSAEDCSLLKAKSEARVKMR